MSTAVRSQPFRARQRMSESSQWQLGELLYEDSWTQTFAAQPAGNESKTDFVIKLARPDLPTEYDRQLASGLLQREATISHLVRHCHLAATLQILANGSHIWLLQPRLAGSLLSAAKDAPLRQKLWIVRQIAQALAALHAARWLHGNLSAEAVFVASSGHVILGNLGWCRNLGSEECDLATTAFTGEIRSAAPEMFDDAGILTPAADVYSLGVLFVELFTTVAPLAQYEGPELIAAKRLLPSPEIHAANLPFELRSLSARMLRRDPLRRPTVAEVMQTLIAAEIASFC